jgi:nitrite reductase/ring-hydroxylating ferredoxin subunit
VERIDRLTTAPEVGKFYLVPVVVARWYYRVDAWPVIGHLHQDKEFFDVDDDHYHIDGRFLNRKQRDYATAPAIWRYGMADNIQAAPLGMNNNKDHGLPRPEYRPRKCSAVDIPYLFGGTKQVKRLRAHYARTQCAKGKGGWICPHRKAPLGSVAVIDGVITCPLHGLRINAETGICLPRSNQ